MTSPATGPLRALRLAAVTAVVLVLGIGAHVLAGGLMPSPVVVAVLAVLLVPAVLTATRSQVRAGRAVALLGGAQLAIHLVLHSMEPVVGTAAALHVHGQDAVVAAGARAAAVGAQTGMAGMAGMAGMSGSGGMAAMAGLTPAMLLAHAAGTVVTAWLLARGEAVLWLVLCFLVPGLPGSVRPLPRPAGVAVTPLPRAASTSVAPVGSRAPPLPAT